MFAKMPNASYQRLLVQLSPKLHVQAWNNAFATHTPFRTPQLIDIDSGSLFYLLLLWLVQLWHALAKTLSEKTAWALAMDRGVDMVAINAGLLTGPGLSSAHPCLKGVPEMYEHGVLVTVDADFLADAHVAAYEWPWAAVGGG